MKQNKSVISIIMVLAGLFFTGCEEGPLGFDELERGDLAVHQAIIEADSMAVYSEEIALGESPTLIGGRDSLTEARILFAIDGLDSITAFDSVKLILSRYEERGIQPLDMTFRVYPLTTEWEEATCTWKLADKYHQWLMWGADFDSTDLLFEFTVNSNQVELKLDAARLEAYQEGMIFLPQGEGFAYLGSYEADALEPEILGFDADDTITFYSGAGSKYYASILDATVIEPFVAPAEDYLIGAGLAWRTFMYFDLNILPDTVDVTSAEFRMVYEPYFIPEDYLDISCYRLVGTYDGSFSDLSSAMAGRDSVALTDDTASISLVEIVQFWADEPDSNFGLVACHSFLKSTPSFGQEKRIYSLGRVVGLPQLVVTYTKPPVSRFREVSE